jgi:outer membrane protein assembly factor BamB
VLTLVIVTTHSYSASAQKTIAEKNIINPWPMFHHDPAHTGVADPGPAPTKLGLKWKFNANGPIVSSPSIAYNRVYFGSYDHNLYCVDAETGNLIWRYETGWRIRSSPAVVDGKVYLGPDDGSVYCLDADTGTLIWKSTFHTEILKTVIQPIAQIRSSPAVVDGRVYVGSLNSRVYCLDAETGSMIWKFKTGDRVVSSPAVLNGKVYVGSTDHHVYALDAENGGFLWKFDNTLDNPRPSPSRSEVDASPCVVGDVVYIFGNAGYWYALEAETGTVKWKHFINLYRGTTGVTQSLPIGTVTYANGKVYFVDRNQATCVNAETGKTIWTSSVYFISYSSPAYADRKIYIGGEAYTVYCFDSETGKKLSSYVTESFIQSSCAIAYEKVYVGSRDWHLYCLDELSPQPPKTETSITALLFNDKVTINNSITLTGKVTPPPKRPPQIIVSFTLQNKTTKEEIITANSNGTYKISYLPDASGNWTVKAFWIGNEHYEEASSPEVSFTVKTKTEPIPPKKRIVPTINSEDLYTALAVIASIIIAIEFYWYKKKL